MEISISEELRESMGRANGAMKRVSKEFDKLAAIGELKKLNIVYGLAGFGRLGHAIDQAGTNQDCIAPPKSDLDKALEYFNSREEIKPYRLKSFMCHELPNPTIKKRKSFKKLGKFDQLEQSRAAKS